MSNADLYRDANLAYYRGRKVSDTPRMPASLRVRLEQRDELPIAATADGDPWNTAPQTQRIWQTTLEDYLVGIKYIPCGVQNEEAAVRLDVVVKAVAAEEHRKAVKYALLQGKPVPNSVLADYPELEKGEGINMDLSKLVLPEGIWIKPCAVPGVFELFRGDEMEGRIASAYVEPNLWYSYRATVEGIAKILNRVGSETSAQAAIDKIFEV